jgi:lipopolysaccharide/colanic/teichoic acid biosynthesis glycosyltransferase
MAMPLIYGAVAFQGAVWRMASPPIALFALLESGCNLWVGLNAMRLSGPINRRAAAIAGRVAAIHGGLALFTLLTRTYYSIPMLLVGMAASLSIGLVSTRICQVVGRLKVGVIGPWRAFLDHAPVSASPVVGDNFAPFDLLLVTAENGLDQEQAQTVSAALLAGKRVRHVADFSEEARGFVSIEEFNVSDLSPRRLAELRPLKRILEVTAILLSAPFWGPLAAGVALLVALRLGRPILFWQERIGIAGAPFRMVKFRTLPQGADGNPGAPTRLTALLRRYRLDELPQFFNILRGEMSLVGPRPEQPGLVERYSQAMPAYTFRHLVRPGITGWAQVRAAYAANEEETAIKLGYDLYYLKYATLALDLQVLALTVFTLLGARGGGDRRQESGPAATRKSE